MDFFHICSVASEDVYLSAYDMELTFTLTFDLLKLKRLLAYDMELTFTFTFDLLMLKRLPAYDMQLTFTLTFDLLMLKWLSGGTICF